MIATDTTIENIENGWLRAFVSDDRFWPTEPQTLEETGLSTALIESLVCKHLAVTGTSSGRQMAEAICLPFRLLEPIYAALRSNQVIVHSNAAPLNDYFYMLTEKGHGLARNYQQACSYVGAAPATLMDYVVSVEAQCISTESPTHQDLRKACADISVDDSWFDLIGPAVNSGAGMFLYGAPGNGKSTLARRITNCFGQFVWIPRVIIEDGQLIKLYDAACHQDEDQDEDGAVSGVDYDHRWVRIRRPTVVVGGELTMDNLEIRYDSVSHVCEAPLQMKSNGGCLLLDDFGRQRIEPAELLNRWIVPLECGHDFLTLPAGKKIKVPFDQLIIFSTNLEPQDLVDEAFLRRIPYKIELCDPNEKEFIQLFQLYADTLGCEIEPSVLADLIQHHYRDCGRKMRRCHPRDLLRQVQNLCRYRQLPFEMKTEYFDRVVRSYFATILHNANDKA